MSGSHEVLIVGGGAAGIAVAASLQARLPGIDIAIVEPATTHFYQPGWTMVGAGIFKAGDTAHDMASVMPRGFAGSRLRPPSSHRNATQWCLPTAARWVTAASWCAPA